MIFQIKVARQRVSIDPLSKRVSMVKLKMHGNDAGLLTLIYIGHFDAGLLTLIYVGHLLTNPPTFHLKWILKMERKCRRAPTFHLKWIIKMERKCRRAPTFHLKWIIKMERKCRRAGQSTSSRYIYVSVKSPASK
jgi:hypothetical protein